MSKRKHKYGSSFRLDLDNWEFLGEGRNGIVYKMDDGNAIKIFKDTDICSKEGYILKKVHGNKYFPKIYQCGFNYIIRQCVNGVCLRDHIEKYGFSRELALKIIKLLEEFKKLKFTRIDTRVKDIFVLNNGHIMIIDPKGFYTRKMNYPRHLCKGLINLNVLNIFLEVLMEERPKLYKKWAGEIYRPDGSVAQKVYKKKKAQVVKQEKLIPEKVGEEKDILNDIFDIKYSFDEFEEFDNIEDYNEQGN